MAVKLKVDLDEKHRAGETYDDFSPTMEGRLIRSGLAEAETLDDARARVGMAPLAQLDHDGDGEPGGSIAPPATDDLAGLRREYRDKLGKAPFPGWGAAELRRRIEAPS